jgi:signal transduction histidine kinase
MSDAAPAQADRAMHDRTPPRLAPGTRLILIAVPVVLLLGTIGLVLAWRNYQSQRALVIDESRLLAASAAADADGFLRGQIALLEAAAASPTMRGPDLAPMEVYLRELLAVQPQMLGIGWIDLDGVIRATATPSDTDAPTVVADRDYFQEVTRAGAPFVSAASTGRPTGRPAVTVAVPTRDTGGALTGVIGARIGLGQLEDAITTVRPRGGGDVLIVDRAGQLIVEPDRPAPTIRDVSASPLLQQARARGSDVLTGVTGLREGPDRIVSFAPVPTGGWIVFLDRPADDAFATARRTLIAEVVALAGVLVAGIAGLVWTGSRLNRAAAERERLLVREQEARAEAEAAVQLRDQVLAGVSHDLKSPLTTIRGLAQVLARQVSRAPDPSPNLRDGLDRIDAATAKMASMMDELLDAARLQMGQPLELNREPTDLIALARAAADVHQRTTERHRIHVEEGPTALVGDWDRARLERVLDNLLTNAIKYSPEGGTITLTVAGERGAEGGWASVSVRDEGIGIPADDLPHIFDRFYRAGNVTGRIAGTGIGLAGARRIVEQHGGTLTAAAAPDRGSIFTMCLPLDSLPEPETDTICSEPVHQP